MSLISKVIPGMFNGISQQPPVLRLDTQCEDVVNGYGTLVDGMMKRPKTQHVTQLAYTVESGSTFTHIIDRDSSEKYLVVIDGSGDVKIRNIVYNTDCTVRYGNLDASMVFTENLAVKNYITAMNPLNTFKATTVADYTILANTAKVCAMDATAATAALPYEGLIYVKKGVAGTNYKVFLNDSEVASYSSGATTSYDTYKSDEVAKALYMDMQALTSNQLVLNFTAEPSPMYPTQGVTISIEGTQIGSKVTYVWDASVGETTYTYNPTATAKAVYDNLIANINTAAWVVSLVGATVYIKKIGASTFTYTVTQDRVSCPAVTAPSTTLTWDIDYVEGTNIIRVRRLDANDFSLTVSDSWSNQALDGIKGSIQNFTDLPATSFEGFTVEVAGDPDKPTDNYWVQYHKDNTSGVWQEIAKPGQTDTFDASTLPHRLVRTGVNQFTFAPILWDNRKCGDDITVPLPSFITSTINDTFFYKNRLGFLSGENLILSRTSDFFNFFPQSATAVLDDDPIDLSVSTNEVSLLYHAIPFNTYLLAFGNQQQFQISAGNTATFTAKSITADVTTKFATSPYCKPVGVGSNVYFVSPKGSQSSIKEYFVQSGSLTNDAADVTAHVSKLLPKNIHKLTASSAIDAVVALSYDTPDTLYVYKYFWNGDEKAQSAWFKWKLEGAEVISCDFIDTELYLVIKRGTDTYLEKIDFEVTNTGILSYPVCLDRFYEVALEDEAPYTDAQVVMIDPSTGLIVETREGLSSVYMGIPYEMKYTFSPWYIKSPQSNVAVQQGRLVIRTLSLTFEDTGYFVLKLEAEGRDTVQKIFNGVRIGSYLIGTTGLQSKTKRFIIGSKTDGVTISLVNDSHLPSTFHSGSFEGTFYNRNKSI